jgi:hexosaminidase
MYQTPNEMQRLVHFFSSLLIITSCAVKEPSVPVSPVSVIPNPVSLVQGNDVLLLPKSVNIVAEGDDAKQVADLLQQYLETKKVNVKVGNTSTDDSSITLSIISNDSLGKEGYNLSVNESGVAINANTGAGLFYGMQTLMQIVAEDGTSVPFIQITDYPRFSYRGLHLDVGRHMFPPEFIKKYIDVLAHHKMNKFHWHLTEDQGWRIEIKKYPKLQQLAAYRNETVIGRSTTATRAEAKYDGERYGGFYTQDEVKDIVAYAAERHVTIVPEIELPGHAQAALTAYPNLGCTGGPYAVATSWGVFVEVFCAGKEDSFKFLQDVFDEIVPLFPGEYVHIGGDECPKERWKKCPHCQKRMKTENIKDEHELQSYFIQRMEKYLNTKGKKIIGWDEILEGGLAPNATVMSWRGEEGGIAAAKENHDVIMTPGQWCYFDKYQDTTSNEPLASKGVMPVSKVYSYEPVPAQLSSTEAKHVLGVQGNVWTEYMTTSDYVEYMVYPRASALAEVAWSQKEDRNYNDFVERMKTHVKRLAEWNVNYAKHIEKEFKPVSTAQQ